MAVNAGHIMVFHDVPAPYRLLVFNRLNELADGRLTLLFYTTIGMQDKWSLPIDELRCDWRFVGTKSGWKHPWSTVKAVSATARILLRIRPSAVVCSGYGMWPAWVCLPLCKMIGARFVTWVSATARDIRPKSHIRNWLKKRFVRSVDGLGVVGKASAEYMEMLGASTDRFFLIPNGFDIAFFAAEAEKVRESGEKALRAYPPKMLLCSGRLVASKGVYVLLEAYQDVVKKHPGVGLLFVGNGDERANMEKFCQSAALDQVYFAGAQPYEKLPYYYGLADVVVLPTFSDTWGMVVTEAFACGVPAIVSRVAGVCDDLIVDGVTGFTVTPGDATELAERILQLLENGDLSTKMSENCRKAIAGYTVEACAKGLWRAAVGEQPSTPIPSLSAGDTV